MFRRLIKAQMLHYSTPVRVAHPISIRDASVLGELTGRDINGSAGAIRYGAPGVQTQKSDFKGYVFPAQLFVGWHPGKVAAGTVRNPVASLPSTAMPEGTYNPLLAAMSNVTQARGKPQALGR